MNFLSHINIMKIPEASGFRIWHTQSKTDGLIEQTTKWPIMYLKLAMRCLSQRKMGNIIIFPVPAPDPVRCPLIFLSVVSSGPNHFGGHLADA